MLDKPLSQQDIGNARNLLHPIGETSDYEFSEEELEDCADTDDDGLWDFEEVMFFLYGNPVITVDDNENIILPTVADVLGEGDGPSAIYFKAFGYKPYVESGYEKAQEQYGDCWMGFLEYPVLPIISDPTLEDGDYDGIVDYEENKWELMPLNSNYIFFDDWGARIDKNDEYYEAVLNPYVLDHLISYLMDNYQIVYVGGHRDFVVDNPTECPGETMYNILKGKEYYNVNVKKTNRRVWGVIIILIILLISGWNIFLQRWQIKMNEEINYIDLRFTLYDDYHDVYHIWVETSFLFGSYHFNTYIKPTVYRLFYTV